MYSLYVSVIQQFINIKNKNMVAYIMQLGLK